MSTAVADNPTAHTESRRRRRSERPVGGALRGLFMFVAGAFMALAANATFLYGVTLFEGISGRAQQSYFSLLMYLAHVGGGLALLPFGVAFVLQHAPRGWGHRNRKAARLGVAQSLVAAVLVIGGLLLLRGQWSGGAIGLADGPLREGLLWVHRFAGPLLVVLYLVHRQLGRGVRRHVILTWGTAFIALVGVFSVLHQLDPRGWNPRYPAKVASYFRFGAETAEGRLIAASALANNDYCASCHAEVHGEWKSSAHARSSFENPRYALAAAQVRAAAVDAKDPTAELRACAACHDPVSLFSGAFEQPRYQKADFDLASAATARAGVTCVSCHAVTHVDEPVGDGRYRVEEPTRYPFAHSRVPLLQWLHRQLLVARPRLHRESMLKPLHQTAEFCGVCHRQSIPNGAGADQIVQAKNHYDSFRDGPWSGRNLAETDDAHAVSGNCASCHMPPVAQAPGRAAHLSHAFADRVRTSGESTSRLDPNPFDRAIRIDLFGLRADADLDAEMLAPLGEKSIEVRPGGSYLLEVVLTNESVGHVFPGGPADQRQTWLELRIASDAGPIGESGSVDASSSEIDPEAHFVAAYLIDELGERIKLGATHRALTALYDHQLKPGQSRLVRYRVDLPDDVSSNVTISARLLDRCPGESTRSVAEAKQVVAVAGESRAAASSGAGPAAEASRRWAQYGRALIDSGQTRGDPRELLRADAALEIAVRLGSAEALLERARIAVVDRRFDEAAKFVLEARGHRDPPPSWRLDVLTGEIELANAQLDKAISAFRAARGLDTKQSARLGLRPVLDAGLLRRLGEAQAARSAQVRNDAAARDRLRRDAIRSYEESLALDAWHIGALRALAALHSAGGDAVRAAELEKRAEAMTTSAEKLTNALGIARDRDPIAAKVAAKDSPHVYRLKQ